MKEENEDKKEPEVDTDPGDDVVFENEEAPARRGFAEGESGEESNPLALIKKLKDKIKLLEQKNQEYLTGWQKERADSVNLRRRLEEEKKEFAKFAKEDIATEIIPVLDSFDSAFKNKEAWEKVDKNWRQGVEYIHAQLIGVLSNHGVKIISPLGEKFDPQRDEAIENVPVENEKDNHKILEVVTVGYKLQNKIIRPPKVKVGEYSPK